MTIYKTKVEIYDLSALAMTCKEASVELRVSGQGHWFDVQLEDRDEEFMKSLVERVIGVSNILSLVDIGYMASCCGLGYRLQDGEEVCAICGAHKKPRKSGDPPWRVPAQRPEIVREKKSQTAGYWDAIRGGK